MGNVPSSRKARVAICLRQLAGIVDLVWVHEDAKGVYFGFYGKEGGTHFSYHVDGRTHFRGRQRDLLLPPRRKTPIFEIGDFEQLAMMAIPVFPDALDKISQGFRGHKDASSVFITDWEFFAGASPDGFRRVLNIACYLLHHTSEHDFIERVCSIDKKDPSIRVLNLTTIPLACFPDYKVAIEVKAFST